MIKRVINDYDCVIVRRADVIRCYVRLEEWHPLYGCGAAEIGLAIDFAPAYSEGGARGWHVGFDGAESWDDAERLCWVVTEMLGAFEPASVETPVPLLRRRSDARDSGRYSFVMQVAS